MGRSPAVLLKYAVDRQTEQHDCDQQPKAKSKQSGFLSLREGESIAPISAHSTIDCIVLSDEFHLAIRFGSRKVIQFD
jgi:hypothetical protein